MTDDLRTKPTLTEILALVVVLPPLAYAFGFLMWAGPSMIIYDANVAHLVPASALLFAGSLYLVVLALSMVFAAAVGSERLLSKWPPSSRTQVTVVEGVAWLLGIAAVSWIGAAIAYKGTPKLLGAGNWEAAYVLLHIVILGFGFRRLYGLTRGRWFPPSPERRGWSARLRLAHASVLILVLYAQVPLALLFGVMGPNPAKNRWPALLQTGDYEIRVLVISHTADHIIGFNETSGQILVVPNESNLVLKFEPHNRAMQTDDAARRR